MDVPAMFRAAVAEFGARVQQIGDHQWAAATPDEGWSVRDLVNHIVGEGSVGAAAAGRIHDRRGRRPF